MRSKTAVAIALVAALALAGAAIGATRSTGTLVTLHKTSLGKVLASSKGMTLYLYTPDPKGKSTCYAGCASTWPPLITKGKPRAGTGVKTSLLGTTKRKNGKLQVTYNGHPLYRYVGDSAPGATNGEGSGGIWFAVSAKGKKVASSTGGSSGW